MDSNFAGNCVMQMEHSKHTRCEENGTFSAVQCMGAKCFCVNTETGEKLNGGTFSMRERDTVNCSAGEEGGWVGVRGEG